MKFITYPLIAALAIAGMSAQAANYNRLDAYHSNYQKRNDFYNQARAAGLSDSRAKVYAVSAMRSKNPSALLNQMLKKAGIKPKPTPKPTPTPKPVPEQPKQKPETNTPECRGSCDDELLTLESELPTPNNGAGVNVEGNLYPPTEEVRLAYQNVAFGRSDVDLTVPRYDYAVKDEVQTVEMPAHPFREKTKRYLYAQPYSAVFGDFIDRTRNEQGETIYGRKEIFVTGWQEASRGNALPSEGKATYVGKSIDPYAHGVLSGTFTYQVDFDKRTGQGQIKKDWYEITLNEAPIGKVDLNNNGNLFAGIEGVATTNSVAYKPEGSYKLAFFGYYGDEVAGIASLTPANPKDLNHLGRNGTYDIGFAGKTNDISSDGKIKK